VRKRGTQQPQLFPRWTPGDEEHDPFAVFVGWVRALEGTCGEELISDALLPPAEAAVVKWLNCGMVWDDEVVSITGPEGPGRPLDSSMLDLLEVGDVEARYFLSPNAATGMLRRADRMQRKFLPALRRALERLKAQSDKTDPARRLAEGEQ
jgi:hypothetical protein